jgi:Domain of unknown function (DUF4188)
MPIFPGRYTARTDEPFVVFLIGMRVNRFLQFSKWMQVAKAMPPMIAELKKHPELGLLHVETILYWRGVASIQYWRSFEHLHTYAKMKEGQHLPAWAEFNRRIGNNGAVGIWHETFMVQPGNHEAIYVNMPLFGLGAGVSHVPVTGRLDSAYGRMQRAGSAESNLVEK